jgi:histidine ammonia-lyase
MVQPKEKVVLNPGQVNLRDLLRIYRGGLQVELAAHCYERLDESHKCVRDLVHSGETVYGINTGFGMLASKRIPQERLEELQRNLVLSHSVGTGPALAANTVRLVLAIKAISLARGFSGVRRELVDALLALLNCQLIPQIPAKGSVGASGDLAPLAHLSCTLIGLGSVLDEMSGEIIPGSEALRRAGLSPFVLGPKEGLALLNGTQVSTALALSGLFQTEEVFSAAMVAGALSLEAIKGSVKPFDERIHLARGQQGQIKVAEVMRQLTRDSEIVDSHANCGRVQDPYSIRCIPQVMGACLDNLNHAAIVLAIEANAASDNPLIFAETNEAISGGNFHAEPVAMAADAIAVAIAEIGSISERRIALLMDSNLSGLPPFLTKDGGINSGLMITQVTAAALVSENKALAHPSSVDSIPTSANQEDHVSMATYAARRLLEMATNAEAVIGIEAMAAAQGIEYHRPLRSSVALEDEFACIRERVSALGDDRYLASDIESMRIWVQQSSRPALVRAVLPTQQ